MAHKGGFKNIKLGKNVYRQMKRRGRPDTAQPRQQPKSPPRKSGPGSVSSPANSA